MGCGFSAVNKMPKSRVQKNLSHPINPTDSDGLHEV